MPRRLQPVLDVMPADARDGRPAHLDRLRDPLIRPGGSVWAVVGLEQHPAILPAGGAVGVISRDTFFQVSRFSIGQQDGTALDGYGRPSFCVGKGSGEMQPRYQRRR